MAGQHRANGGPSWSDTDIDAPCRVLPAALPVVDRVWAELDATLDATQPGVPDLHDGHPSGPGYLSPASAWQPPAPRPRPSWTSYDFACWVNFLHPDTGVSGHCGCRQTGCAIRAHLDLVDWGPDGPPLTPARRETPGHLPDGWPHRA